MNFEHIVREVFMEMTPRQRPAEGKTVHWLNIGKYIPGGRNTKGKDPEADVLLMNSNHREVNTVGVK